MNYRLKRVNTLILLLDSAPDELSKQLKSSLSFCYNKIIVIVASRLILAMVDYFCKASLH